MNDTVESSGTGQIPVGPDVARMVRILAVKFKDACKVYDFDPAEHMIRRGERIVVETERGLALATAAADIREIAAEAITKELKKVLRVAGPEDLQQDIRNREKEAVAQKVCLGKIRERGLPMKLVSVEYAFDGNKAIFYFTADGRVDFRELVRDLAHEFHVRIEMKQIGIRDAAKLMGGVGPCGKELCCSSFISEFGPVSVKMAKEQGLSLNPAKISGICGRLMCCLSFEHSSEKGEGKRKGGHHHGHHGHQGKGGCGGGCHSHGDGNDKPEEGQAPN